jgi:dihydrofolate synthase/folylpolyglutamate synthase
VPGRLEVVGRHPLVLVDGAHNAAGMVVLARSLSEEFTTEGETIAVVGMLTGRDPTAMLDALVSAGVRSVIACAPDSPRALPVGDVAAAAASLGMEVALSASPAEAVRRAVERAQPEDRVVVCGSLYVVADAREVLRAEGT